MGVTKRRTPSDKKNTDLAMDSKAALEIGTSKDTLDEPEVGEEPMSSVDKELSPVIARSTVLQASKANGNSREFQPRPEHYDNLVLCNLCDYNKFEKFAREEDERGFLNIYTVSRKYMPSWYVDNEYVFRGYRRITNSYMGCFKSLFYVHNETGNIWTHGLGAIGFIVLCVLFYMSRKDTIIDALVMGRLEIIACTIKQKITSLNS